MGRERQTNAEYAKAYRLRKKLLKPERPLPKTEAERKKIQRDRKREKEALERPPAKSDAQRSKEYYNRKRTQKSEDRSPPTTSSELKKETL